MNSTFKYKTIKDLNDGIVPVDLLCEYMRNPVGLNTVNPRFSWHVLSDERGQYQTAYRIVVASSKEKLEADIGDIWDTGKVESSKCTNIVFEGCPLISRQLCFWKVRIWDRYLNESAFSVCSRFEMGLLQQEDWRAVWIGSPVFGAEAPLFRKTFTIGKKVARARVYISGLGYYELHINGRKVGDRVLDPAWTDYGKRVLYAAYAVEEYLKQGSNVIGIMLGAGWYGKAYRNNVHAVTQLLLQMELEFEDGTAAYILTGPESGWKVHSNGPVTFSSIYDGESYDARLEIDGWDLAEPESYLEEDGKSEWLDPLWMEPPGGRMESQMMEPIKVIKVIKPISLSNPKPGVQVYDLSQNIAGWVKLQVSGPRSTKIILKYAELLYEDGTVNQENLRTAKHLVKPCADAAVHRMVMRRHFTLVSDR
jgi:alpha-L-rhamnosidase